MLVSWFVVGRISVHFEAIIAIGCFVAMVMGVMVATIAAIVASWSTSCL